MYVHNYIDVQVHMYDIQYTYVLTMYIINSTCTYYVHTYVHVDIWSIRPLDGLYISYISNSRYASYLFSASYVFIERRCVWMYCIASPMCRLVRTRTPRGFSPLPPRILGTCRGLRINTATLGVVELVPTCLFCLRFFVHALAMRNVLISIAFLVVHSMF